MAISSISTETGVCNLAIDILEKMPMTNVETDDNPESRWFLRNYATLRDGELRAHVWNFSVQRSEIAVDATAPEFDWLYRYALPTGCLRVLPPRYNGEFESTPIPHEIEADSDGTRWIYTDQTTPLKLRWVKQIVDVTKWDPLFVTAFSAKLAMRGAHRFSGKASMVQVAGVIYQDAIREAKRIDAIEGTPERPYDNDVIAARYR